MAIDNSGTDPFSRDEDEGGMAAPADASTTAGAGGGDMDVWTRDEETQLTKLASRTHTDNSSYVLPPGAASATFSRTEHERDRMAPTPGAPAEAGAGGGYMDVWDSDGPTVTTKLTGHTFVNESSFLLPGGVSSSTFSRVEDTEMGTNVRGSARAANGSQASGTVKLLVDGEAVAGRAVEGYFKASFGAPESATQGTTADPPYIPSYSVTFTPSGDAALPTGYDNVPYPGTQEIKASYGAVTGTVYDANGDPVKNASIGAGNVKAFTDAQGNFTVAVPGNEQATLQALAGTAERTVVISPQATVTEDFQYAGVEVEVVGPEGDPVPNAPVQIDGDEFRTDDTGTALYPTASIGDHSVRIMDTYEDAVTATIEGEVLTVRWEGGSKLTVRCRDARSGRSIAELRAFDQSSGSVSFSTVGGVVSLLTAGNNTFEAVVGYGGRRYKPLRLERDAAEGEVVEEELVLEPRPAITNH